MVELVPMSDADFHRYMESAVEDYAQSRFKCGGCTLAESRAQAKEDYDQLLGQGIASPGQHLFCVRAEGFDRPVGMVWLAMRERHGVKSAYIYHIQVEPAHRGKGFGEQALRLVEAFAVSQGAARLSLNVWEWNRPARSLYEKAGFSTIGLGMTKVLSPP